MKGAVVIGGHVQGLGIVRMLGSKKIPVVLMDVTGYNVARFSKYCSRFIKMPADIFESEQKFCDFLKEKSQQYNLQDWLLFPTDDQTVAYISRNKGELSDYYTVWTPAWDVVEQCYNKKLTYSLAKKTGVPYPHTCSVEDIQELHDIAAGLCYPVIVKPAVRHKFSEATHAQFYVAENREELLDYYKLALEVISSDEILIQEMIPCRVEDNVEVGVFFCQGKISKSVTIKKIRQIPMKGGTGTSYQIIPDNPLLLGYCKDLLESINYYGICDLEFIWDQRDKTYKVIDINPRTFKWHYLSGFVGYSLPYQLYCDIYRLNPESCCHKRTNDSIKYFDEILDCSIAWYEIMKGRLKVRDYVQSIKGSRRYAVASWNDPLPFIVGTIIAPRVFWNRRVI
jgi:D-aspartate ligase